MVVASFPIYTTPVSASLRLPHSLVPLNLAAEHIRRAVYADRPGLIDKDQLLDSIATTISVVARIYEYDAAHSNVGARQLSRIELEYVQRRRKGTPLH
jgi:hypothetical protein